MIRTPEDQSLVDFMLHSIKSKTVDEIIAMNHSVLKVMIPEMLQAGLQISQLNQLPDDFLKEALNRDEISRQELIDAGMEGEKLESIAPLSVNPLDSANSSNSKDSVSDFVFDGLNDANEMGADESILAKISAKKATAIDVRNALLNHTLSEADLITNFGYSSDMIKRIREFEPQVIVLPPLTELPPLRADATDIYFLGMPASGKSTMLASFLY